MINLVSCHQEKKDVSISFPRLNEEMLKKDQLTSLYNENRLFLRQMCLINSKGKAVCLEEINKGTSLVIRYSAHSCSDCISFINKSVLENAINKEDILLFLSDIPIRDLHVIKKQLNLPDVYRIESLPLSFDEEKIPYVFVIDSSYCCSSFFVPRKEIPEQTDRYFDFIKKERL